MAVLSLNALAFGMSAQQEGSGEKSFGHLKVAGEALASLHQSLTGLSYCSNDFIQWSV